MVWSPRTEAELPPLSVILPRLYLGAQSDVTQDRLSSLDISYVLSVSRCSPQPSFLPETRFLRVPIDDSLWADLLPWIPQALHFIDAALSSGASVLVHCAAGVSRSPALAVAYIMYHLGLDLDQAYRFVKERRPSISPNFNFLGQLQHFQSTLTLKTLGGVSAGRPSDPWPSGDLPRSSPSATDQQEVEDLQPQQLVQAPSLCAANTAAEPRPDRAELSAGPSSASLSEKRRSLTLSLSPLEAGPPPGPTRSSSGSSGSSSRSAVALKQPLLSPLSLTLNKLMGWGERVLLGGVFMPAVRMGQPALPHRC